MEFRSYKAYVRIQIPKLNERRLINTQRIIDQPPISLTIKTLKLWLHATKRDIGRINNLILSLKASEISWTSGMGKNTNASSRRWLSIQISVNNKSTIMRFFPKIYLDKSRGEGYDPFIALSRDIVFNASQ